LTYSTHFDINDIRLQFSGHETFPFRYPWLPKGVQGVSQYYDLFLRDDAIVILGVGKNMVQSIRYWCESLDLVESPERGNFRVTRLGEKLFSADGWDPYLEHPTTLWLLHWKLASKLEKSTTWFLAFTRWGAPNFTKVQLRNWINGLIERNISTRTTPNSLKRDIDVFVRTYVQSTHKIKYLEDSYDCPLVELGLIIETEPDVFEFTKGSRESLPEEMFIYALHEYWEINSPKQNSISFEIIQHGPGSPGRVFGLSENSMYERLERLPEWAGMSLDTTAGMRTIFRRSDIVLDPILILARYYTKKY
jgi:hypothetical protein